MTEIAVPENLLQPVTGELIDRNDVAGIAGAVEQIRDAKRALDEALSMFTAAAADISRQHGTRTLTAGGYELVLSADSAIEWDTEMLASELRRAGLPEERIDALLVATVTYKVDGRVVRQLEAASPLYAGIIDRARSRVPKRQYVTVKS